MAKESGDSNNTSDSKVRYITACTGKVSKANSSATKANTKYFFIAKWVLFKYCIFNILFHKKIKDKVHHKRKPEYCSVNAVSRRQPYSFGSATLMAKQGVIWTIAEASLSLFFWKWYPDTAITPSMFGLK